MTDRHQPCRHGQTVATALLALLLALGAAATSGSASSGNARDGLVAFISTSSGTAQLYTVQPDATLLQQLTWDPAGVGSPRWAPDGRRLVVLTGCSNNSGRCPAPTGFATMRPDGSDRVDVAGTGPVFSPDGKWLAYFVCSVTLCDLYVAHANGRHTQLIDTSTRSPLSPGEPAWSSDSRRLVYVKAAGAFEKSIWLADLRAGGRVEVLKAELDEISTPVFFPDDKTVTFIMGSSARIFTISLGEAQPIRRNLIGDSGYLVLSPMRTRLASQGITLGPGGVIRAYNGDVDEFGEFVDEFGTPKPFSYAPVWSPDGSMIVHTFCDRSTAGFTGGPCSIQLVGSGSNPSTIHNGPVVEGGDWVRGYDWSPDSAALVLSVSSSRGPFRLNTVNVDGSGLAPLSSGSDNQYTPAWQPWRLASKSSPHESTRWILSMASDRIERAAGTLRARDR